jgi:hypothetical protein
MINVSNEYKEAIRKSGKKQYGGAVITLKDDTELILDNSNIMENGISIKDGTSASNSFHIGSATINELTLNIANFDGAFNEYDFTDAVIRPTVGLQLSETIETLNKGVFIVEDPRSIGGMIVITALDNMAKFDVPFSDVTISFPCTAITLLNAVCLRCGVSLASAIFTNSVFSINRRPDDEAITCREIVAWIAQLGGNFARCNVDGALEIKWYDIGAFETTDHVDGGSFDNSTHYSTGDNVDGGNFTDYNSGDSVDGGTFEDMDRYHHIYALGRATIGTDDVIITGIKVKAMGTESDYGETVLFGSEGYVIEISDNPLIQEGNAGTIANSVGAKIVGMRFRICSVTATSDPSREAGDVAYLSHKNNSYPILITNLTYQIGNLDVISCDAETPSKKQSVRFSAQTKTVVESRKIAKQEISTYDLAVQQLTNLITYGYGLHKSQELQPDGSYKYYMHNQPTIAESSVVWTINSGGLSISTDHGITWGVDTNGNMLVNVLTAIGINAEWINVLTSFTVGDNFSVDADGKLTASNVVIEGEIEASSGTIAGMDITGLGLQKTSPNGYINKLWMSDDGFWLQSNNTGDTERAFINVTYDSNDHPLINISVVKDGAYDNANIYVNGQPILTNIAVLQSKMTHITNFMISHFGYDPSE